jgi:hypothetical protein
VVDRGVGDRHRAGEHRHCAGMDHLMSKHGHNLSRYQQRRHERRMREERQELERERRLRKVRATSDIYERALADELPNANEEEKQ